MIPGDDNPDPRFPPPRDARAAQTPPPLPVGMARPTCWKCGYDLTGLQVTGSCPECATPVWSGVAPTAAGQAYSDALTWGIVSLVLLFVCLGPLAAFVAIPAVVKGKQAMDDVAAGRLPMSSIQSAKTGRTLGWVTIWLSVAFTALYAVILFLNFMR